MSLRFRSVLFVAAALASGASFAAGCSHSHTVPTTENDAGIVLPDGNIPDANLPDASGRPDVGPDTGPPPPACGNGRIEGGESCDDGNTMSGDGCSGTCTWEARCGDRHPDPGEACDDGNHLSGDGCRSDCLSTETCGNHISDYATGEVCDDGNTMDGDGCAGNCRSLPLCGNGMIDSGEQCDNDVATPPARWDGCGADCRTERSMVLHDESFAGAGMGCDYSGDGNPDNRFADALGSGLSLLNMLFMQGGGPTILISYSGLDDASGANDPDLRAAWLTGTDADGNAANNYTGMGQFRVDMASLAADRSPAVSLQTSITSNALLGGPEDLDLNLGFFPLTLRDAYLRGTTTAMGGELWSLDNAFICGVVQSQSLAFVNESLIASFGMGFITIDPPCDGSTQESSLVDWLAGGATLATIRIRPTSPDVDLDGDGLETYEVTGRASGAPRCQPVITACIDGNGTRVEGRDCYNDQRFQDGYSAALSTQAIRAIITGVN